MAELEKHVLPGKQIRIEGNDGTGKSTVANMIAWQVRQNNIEVIRVDEPDSAVDVHGNILVPEAKELRVKIKDGSYEHNPHDDLQMFNDSRYANWTKASRPFLMRGGWVIQARDDMSSSIYQGHADGLGVEFVREKTREKINDPLYFEPDFRTVIAFDNELERLERVKNRATLEVPDTFESRGPDFQAKVNEGYLLVAQKYGYDISPITKEHSPENVADAVWVKMIGRIGVNLTKFDWAEYTPPELHS